MLRSSCLLALLMLPALFLGACRNTRAVASENERLRFQVLDLESQLDSLQHQNRELRVDLREGATAPDALPEEIRANIPHVTDISLSRLSHARDANNDGQIDALVLYVVPEDGRGRFVQIVGSLAATALLLPTDGDPIVLSRMELTPSQVRDAYRSNLTGIHYTITLPIDQLPDAAALAAVGNKVFVRVVYTDGRSGQTFTAERTIKLR